MLRSDRYSFPYESLPSFFRFRTYTAYCNSGRLKSIIAKRSASHLSTKITGYLTFKFVSWRVLAVYSRLQISMFALLSKARLLGRGGQSLLHNCFTSSITPSYLYTRSIVACIQHVQHVAPISRIVIHRGIRTSSEGLPAPPPLSSLVTSQDMQEARQWIEHFRIASIPKDVVEITFSRSSGPGGQVCARSPLRINSGPGRMTPPSLRRMSTKSIRKQPCDAPWTRTGYPYGHGTACANL